MDALLLVGGAFLIWASYCLIAWATGYSPEESARRRIERFDELLSFNEDRINRLQATAETPEEKKEVEELQVHIEMLRRFKAREEQIFSIPDLETVESSLDTPTQRSPGTQRASRL